ncbi:MAG: hypothetical protein MHPSP_003040 [Paramarteilia canceri]
MEENIKTMVEKNDNKEKIYQCQMEEERKLEDISKDYIDLFKNDNLIRNQSNLPNFSTLNSLRKTVEGKSKEYEFLIEKEIDRRKKLSLFMKKINWEIIELMAEQNKINCKAKEDLNCYRISVQLKENFQELFINLNHQTADYRQNVLSDIDSLMHETNNIIVQLCRYRNSG